MGSDSSLAALASGTCNSAAQAALAAQAPQAPLTVRSVRTLPYAGGACAFKFQMSDPSRFAASFVVAKLANSMGDPNQRSYLVEVDDQASVPQFVDSFTPSGSGSAYTSSLAST